MMRLFKTPTNTPDYCSAAPAADRQNRSFKALSGKGSAPASPGHGTPQPCGGIPDNTHTVTELSPSPPKKRTPKRVYLTLVHGITAPI